MTDSSSPSGHPLLSPIGSQAHYADALLSTLLDYRAIVPDPQYWLDALAEAGSSELLRSFCSFRLLELCEEAGSRFEDGAEQLVVASLAVSQNPRACVRVFTELVEYLSAYADLDAPARLWKDTRNPRWVEAVAYHHCGVPALPIVLPAFTEEQGLAAIKLAPAWHGAPAELFTLVTTALGDPSA